MDEHHGVAIASAAIKPGGKVLLDEFAQSQFGWDSHMSLWVASRCYWRRRESITTCKERKNARGCGWDWGKGVRRLPWWG